MIAKQIQVYVTTAIITIFSGPTDLLVFPWIKFQMSLWFEISQEILFWKDKVREEIKS
jgi:hypothetical protein